MKKILILTDGKAGHENQSKAFARALGCELQVIPVAFRSKFHKALSYLFDRIGLRATWLWGQVPTTVDPAKPLPPLPDPFEPSAVIGTGSGTFYAAKSLAKKLGVKCGVVLYPRGYDIASFDCILAPAFDRPAKAANVIEIPANLVAADAEFYAKGVAAFREHYEKSTNRRLAESPDATAVIIGGPNKCSTMTVDWMKKELDRIFSEPTPTPTSHTSQLRWVTTSRRTPADVEALVDSYPWDYKLLYSRDRFNPIPAFVQLAKRLCVTAESTGMLSEACTFGSAEVKALDNLNPGPHKFRRFVDQLRAGGYVDGTRKVDLSAQFAGAKRLMGL